MPIQHDNLLVEISCGETGCNKIMDPLRHLSLVREFGVDWYIPRTSLLISPPSLEKVTIAAEVAPTSGVALEPVVTKPVTAPAAKKSKPDIDFGLDIVKKSAINDRIIAPKVSPRVVAEKIDSFSLLVASSASLIFVTDVKTNPLTAVWERSVRQFFDEIEVACVLNSKKVQSLDYFSWPIPGSAKLNLGEDQLIQLLTGFMGQHITSDKKGVILFGENAKQYGSVALSSIAGLQVIAAPSLGSMFTGVAAKVALWKDLQALIKGRV
jgi:hypothetical protein